MAGEEGNSEARRKPRFRFGIGSILVLMLVFAVIAAGAGYLVRASSIGSADSDRATSLHLTFLLFTLASPVLLMIVLSVCRRIMLWLNRPRP